MKKTMKLFYFLFLFLIISSCEFTDYLESKALAINNYERVALNLSRDNRVLQTKMSNLEFEIQGLKSRNQYLELKFQKKNRKIKRKIASFIPSLPRNNYVKNDIYNWNAEQLLATADKEFQKKNYEKSAQFYHAISLNYTNEKILTDSYHFRSGIASYESGKHDDWTFYHLNSLITKYPSSTFYRGAKLWMAMTNLRQGHHKKFFKTVEEFRRKYKNTKEWDVLKGHYEKIVQRYK